MLKKIKPPISKSPPYLLAETIEASLDSAVSHPSINRKASNKQDSSSNKGFRILHVEDDKVDRLALKRFLQKDNSQYQIETASSITIALTKLEASDFDLALINLNLGPDNGLDIIPHLKSTPSIMLMGVGNEEIAFKAIKMGATDYLVKETNGEHFPKISTLIKKITEEKERFPNSLQRKFGRRKSDQLKVTILNPIMEKMFSGERMGEILFSLRNDLKNLFDCQSINIYEVDHDKRQVYARHLQERGEKEIRYDISPNNLPGYVAATGKLVNLADEGIREDLNQYHPCLKPAAYANDGVLGEPRPTLVIPLPHHKRLMGVLELANKNSPESFTDEEVKVAKELSITLGQAIARIEFEDIEEMIQSLTNSSNPATAIDQFLVELPLLLLHLLGADRITIYGFDPSKNEIFSKMKSGNIINEIRLPVSPNSISGFVALEKKPVNIINVHDKNELKRIHPNLKFDDSWDEESGLDSKSMLTLPINRGDRLLGVLQLVSRTNGKQFNEFDERNAMATADKLAIGFLSQGSQMGQRSHKFSYLVENGLVIQSELDQAISQSRSNKTDLEHILLRELKIKRKDIGTSLSLYYGIPYMPYSSSVVIQDNIFSGLNKKFLLRDNWIPVSIEENIIVVLINDPLDQEKIRNIKLIFPKKEIEFRIGLKADIRDFLSSGVRGDDIGVVESNIFEISDLLDSFTEETEQNLFSPVEVEEDISDIKEPDSNVVKLINRILLDAFNEKVSDIHIEPGLNQKDMQIRFRRDGICRTYLKVPCAFRAPIISRVKIMAKLDISEKRLPQDGKIIVKHKGENIEFRVATIPTLGNNEDAVIRLLSTSKAIPITSMNFSVRNLKLIEEKIVKNHGLILVVGPTGSGKTTTLHSCLALINTPEKKIWTAEDPIEITQEGLRQMPIQQKIGMDFSRAMRSLLRGDPDVIMVGEMRDVDTCKIVLEAALTGHLVLSTLHTNSAPETIVRLLNMGMNPFNFSDALLLIVAQRLVRSLCENCKEDHHLSQEEFDLLTREYGEEKFSTLGINYTDQLTLKKAVGCAKCGDTGFMGRIPLHEVLNGTQTIKEMIEKRESIEKIRFQAIEEGMTTLKQDGIQKVFEGHTSLQQVMAVC